MYNARPVHPEQGGPEPHRSQGPIPHPAAPWYLIDLMQDSQPILCNVNAKKNAARRDHYERKHAVKASTLLEDPAVTVAYTDAAIKVVGPDTSITAASVFYTHGDAAGRELIATSQSYGTNPNSLDMAETKAAVFALETNLRLLEERRNIVPGKPYISTDSQHVVVQKT